MDQLQFVAPIENISLNIKK